MGTQAAPAGLDGLLASRSALLLPGRPLAEVEAQIERGWVAAASGYREIRDDRLYRQGPYSDFDVYCRDRWNWTRQRVDQLIAGLDVVEALTTNSCQIEPPANELQARALLPLLKEPEAMAAALEEARTEAKARHGKLTAQRIGAAVRRRLPVGGDAGRTAPSPIVSEEQAFDQSRKALERAVVVLARVAQGLSSQVDVVDFTTKELRDLETLIEGVTERAEKTERFLASVRGRRTKRHGVPMPRVAIQPSAGQGAQQRALLEALGAQGPSTTRELLAASGLEMYVASSRMSELRQAGLIVDTGERRRGRGSGQDKVYRLADQEARP